MGHSRPSQLTPKSDNVRFAPLPRPYPTRPHLRRKRDGLFVSLAPGHHRPDHPCDLVGQRDGGDLDRSSHQQCREPGPVLGTIDLGVANDGERAVAESLSGGGYRCGERGTRRLPES